MVYNRYMDIITVTLSIFSLSFFAAYIVSTLKLKKITEAFAELIISQATKDNYIGAKNITENIDVDTENFIKFLSDSRDWAFSYIENVQIGLKKFIDEVEPQIEYYDKYGSAVEGMLVPHDFALKKISTEIKELKKFLPEETLDDRR